jgi:hypothetical protein
MNNCPVDVWDATRDDNLNLLKKHFRPSFLADYNNNILDQCCRDSAIKCVQWLIKSCEAKVTTRTLAMAIFSGNFQCVECVIPYCSTDMINERISYNRGALYAAITGYLRCTEGYELIAYKIICLLIEHGANPELDKQVLSNVDVPEWIYNYPDVLKARKQQCASAAKVLLFALRKRGAPKDMTRWFVQHYIKTTWRSQLWDQ